MAKKEVVVKKERDVRIHASLWNVSGRLLQRGQDDEYLSFYQFMASIVFAAFTMEAYLNWLGQKTFPHWGYLERLSPKQKIELISDQLKVPIDHGVRPWQTLKQLLDFRNEIAHGKPEILSAEAIEPVDEQLDAKLGQKMKAGWERFVTRENAERATKDIEKIVRILHSASGGKDGIDPLSQGSASALATDDPRELDRLKRNKN